VRSLFSSAGATGAGAGGGSGVDCSVGASPVERGVDLWVATSNGAVSGCAGCPETGWAETGCADTGWAETGWAETGWAASGGVGGS
jgi:hypothetical protein